MTMITDNLQKIHQCITSAEQRFGRKTGEVQLLAVSKTQPVEAIQKAIAAGQTEFAENYLQEAVSKITVLRESEKNLNLNWHFIGRIQSNKTREIAEYFDWVHSVDNLKIAQRLSNHRAVCEKSAPLNICLQVNLDQEPQKAGVILENLPTLAFEISKLPHLQLRGLMAIPAFHADFTEQRATFHKLKIAYENLINLGSNLDTLSMGMSADFEAAIAEGATMIRIGTLLFGKRSK